MMLAVERVDSLCFEAFGLFAAVESDDPELLSKARDVLPPGWRPHRGPVSTRFGLMRDGTITSAGVTVPAHHQRESALDRLERMIRHHVAEHAPDLVFVHAGVVAIGEQGIVIPGRSMTGKTTLVAQLVRLGAAYYSDEYAVVSADGAIHAYPRTVRHRFAFTGRHLQVDVPTPAPSTLPPVRAGLVLVTRYEPGATWQPEVLSAGAGAMALLDNTVVAQTRPLTSLGAARRVAAGALVLGGPRGEADAAAEAIFARMPSLAPKSADRLW